MYYFFLHTYLCYLRNISSFKSQVPMPTFLLASFPGHSQILSCSGGVFLHGCEIMWEWYGNESTFLSLAVVMKRWGTGMRLCTICTLVYSPHVHTHIHVHTHTHTHAQTHTHTYTHMHTHTHTCTYTHTYTHTRKHNYTKTGKQLIFTDNCN